LEAKKAGFDVNRQVLNKMLEYLRQQARNRKNIEEYFFYDAGGVRRSKFIAPKEIAYSLFVLTLGGKADISTMNYYKAQKNVLAIDSKYLLGAAYLLMGDNGSYRSLIPDSFSGERSENSLGGSFYSYIRDEGISLNALLDADPQNVQISTMAKHISEQLKKSKWISTQEAAFALLAFGKMAKKNEGNTVSATITANGQNLANFKGEDVILTSNIANKTLNINASGTGMLYYFWQAQGLTNSNEVKEEDNFLKVRKSFYNRNGKLLNGNTFSQNDLVVVKITVASTDGSAVENVVVTDMLPAGFEIENPRISESVAMTWANQNASTPDHLDIRDDRIHFFTTASAEVKTFYYVVRAVSKGTFKMGPVSADAMYNGDYHSINGAGTISVSDRNGNEAIGKLEEEVDSTGN
jgi:alpha-2-macroglobulin